MPVLGVHVGVGRCEVFAAVSPVTDPAITAINSDGWSVAYTSPPPTIAPADNKIVALTRAGFDATGAATSYTETVLLTHRVRQAYPNNASLDASRVAMADYVYSTDAVIGGQTNNSTEASPKPIANWARCDRRVVSATLPKEWLEIVAFHRDARSGEQIACVEWTISDGTASVSVKRSASVVSGDALDLNAVIVYRPSVDVDISPLSNGQLTVNAKVYPWLGDASSVRDSAGGTANSREFCPQIYTKNPTLAASPYYAYVDPAGGNDGTGVVSTTAATAAATPCQTLKGAIERGRAQMPGNRVDGLIVRLVAATHTISADVSFNTYQDNFEVIVEPAPGVSQASAIVSFGSTASRTFQLQWLRFRGLSMLRTGVYGLTGKTSGNSKMAWENVAFDAGAQNSSLSTAANFAWHLHGVAITNPAVDMLHSIDLLRGVAFGTLNFAGAKLISVSRWRTLGCIFKGASPIHTSTVTDSGGLFAFNKLLGVGGSANPVLLWGTGTAADVSGYAFAQNVVEYTDAANGASSLRPSGDSDPGNMTHFVCCHNSFSGFDGYGRGNILYNEGASARTHKLCAFAGNIHVQINSKHDVFKSDGTRVQSWAYLNGVGCRGEFTQFRAGSSGAFAQDYAGLDANLGTSNATRNDPLYVSPQGTTAGPTAGAGNGDYALQAGSPCKGMVKAPALRFDLAGNARPASNDASGAYA